MKLVLLNDARVSQGDTHRYMTHSRYWVNPLQVASVFSTIPWSPSDSKMNTAVTLSNGVQVVVPLAAEVVAAMVNDAASGDDSL
jgi:hypothetical protein